MERGACLRKKGCSCEQLAKENMKKKHTTLPVSLPNSHPPVRARVSPACSGSVSDLGKATLQPPALHQASLCSSLAHASDRGNFHVAFKFPFRDTAHGNSAREDFWRARPAWRRWRCLVGHGIMDSSFDFRGCCERGQNTAVRTVRAVPSVCLSIHKTLEYNYN